MPMFFMCLAALLAVLLLVISRIPRVTPRAGRIALLVSSCLEFHKTTLPVLLDSISQTGVASEDVFVVVGDAPAYSEGYLVIHTSFKVRAFYVPFTCFDHNALMWMLHSRTPEMDPYSWVFQVHDTTTFVREFQTSLADVLEEHLDEEPTLGALRLSDGFSMSMGYYKKDALYAHRKALLERMLNGDTRPETRVEHKGNHIEDGAFKLMASKGVVVRSITGPDPSELLYDVPSPYDRSGSAMRRRQLWARPGLYKYQANYGQAPWHVNL